MGRIKIVLLGAALFLAACPAKAWWKFVINPWAIGQVEANTAAVTLIENDHNSKLSQIQDKQKKIAQFTATMATIKEVSLLSLQNVSGFGEESKMYKEILSTLATMPKDFAITMKYLTKGNVKNYLICMDEIMGLVYDVKHCTNTFKNVVTNGKVSFPKEPLPSATNFGKDKNDGENLLDRWTRWSLANQILSDLKEIQYKIHAIAYMCQYCNSMSNLIFAVDVDSWLSFFTAKNAVDGLISDWEGLGS